MKDLNVVNEVRIGNTLKAVKGLYGYFTVVKKHVLSNNGTLQDAEDVFQDAMVILFQKIKSPDFQLTSSLNTYLFSISKNIWYERLRSIKKQEAYSGEPFNAEGDDIILSEEENKRLRALKAIEQLGDKCRQILNMFYNQGKSMYDIAKKMGFASERGAKNQKYRCIEKAREYYLSNN